MINARFCRVLMMTLMYALAFAFAEGVFLKCASAQDKQNEVQLNADKLTYENATGVASAAGNVVIKNRDMRVFAPYAEYDTRQDVVKAFSDESGTVTLFVKGDKLTGRTLEYNVAKRKGVMTDTSGKVDAIFFKGRDLEVMPLGDALKQKLVSKKNLRKVTDEDMVARWLDVESTTCDFTNPHYRFVAKQITVVPGNKVIIKKPKVYIGKRLLLNYPFDFVASLTGEDKTSNVMPMVAYDSDKGVGVGISGPFSWDSGDIKTDAVYWTDDIWEARFALNQTISDRMSVFAVTEKTYNKDDEDSVWRQNWGMNYITRHGWRATLMESQRELVETEMRLGMDRRYNLWRSPELSIESPWFRDPAVGGYFRLFGMWGRYQDNVETGAADLWVGRYGAGVQVYGEPQIGLSSITPFYNATFWYYDYDDTDGSTQKVTDAVLGFRWGSGSIGLATAYVRRWVSGASPLFWDRYLDKEDIYQQVSYSMPGKASWERWTVSVRAGYDMVDDKIAEMIYSLAYSKHCITWELWARDSRPDDELSIGIKFKINAYPDIPLNLGQSDIYDPFEKPDGIESKEK